MKGRRPVTLIAVNSHSHTGTKCHIYSHFTVIPDTRVGCPVMQMLLPVRNVAIVLDFSFYEQNPNMKRSGPFRIYMYCIVFSSFAAVHRLSFNDNPVDIIDTGSVVHVYHPDRASSRLQCFTLITAQTNPRPHNMVYGCCIWLPVASKPSSTSSVL